MLGHGWLVYELSESPLVLGYLGAAAGIPNILISLFGGMAADRFDKLKLLKVTSLVQAALLALLAVLDATGVVEVWHVLTIVALGSAVTGLDWPARQAIYPSLIDREHIMSAIALNSIVWQAMRMVMPALGGLIIATSDTWVIFALGAAGFLCMAWFLIGLPLRRTVQASGIGWPQFVEGLRFVVREPMFVSLIPLTYCTMLLGTSFIQIMPSIAAALGGGEAAYGLLIAATGFGSMLGTVITSPYQQSSKLGAIMLGAVALTALALQGFGLIGMALSPGTDVLAISLLFAFLMGLFSAVYLISSMTVLQLLVPDELRGRVMSIHGITYSLIPLGGLIGGAVAELSSPHAAVLINAIVLLAIATVIAGLQPALRRFDGRSA